MIFEELKILSHNKICRIAILFSSCQVVDSRMKLDFSSNFVKMHAGEAEEEERIGQLVFLVKSLVYQLHCRTSRIFEKLQNPANQKL